MKLTAHKKNIWQLGMSGLFIILAVWIGRRELTVGADTLSYASFYAEKVSCRCVGSKEIGFEVFGLVPAFLGLPTEAFFVSVSLLSFSLLYYIVRLSVSGLHLSDVKGWRIYLACSAALIGVVLLNPLYAQSHVNALRQGLSALCLVLFVIELAKGRSWHILIWGGAAVSFHLSALLHIPFLLLIVITRGRHPVILILMVTFFLVLYLLGVTEGLTKLISPRLYNFVNEYGVQALGRYRDGVRWDFALFTYFVSIFSIISLRLPGLKASSTARRLAEAACLSSIPFYILGWGVFSNRYLFSSWLMFSVFLGGLVAAAVRARGIPVVAGWVVFLCGVSMFIYQIEVA